MDPFNGTPLKEPKGLSAYHERPLPGPRRVTRMLGAQGPLL